jgi:hypothetical protein
MASYTTYETMVPEILQYCHGAPTILVLSHIRNAVIRFCEKTLVLKKEPSSFYLDEDTNEYTLKFTGDRYRVVSIKEARIGEYPSDTALNITSEHDLDNSIAKWRTREASTPTSVFLSDGVNTCRFYPTPNADSDDEVFMDTVVTMKRDQTEMDTFIYEKWEETIQAGALTSILAIPSASWFNAEASNMFSKVWKKGCRQARATTLKGIGEQPGMAKPQSYVVQGSNNILGRTTSWE